MKDTDGSDPGPVTVLTVRDPGVLAVAQSLLDRAGIPYFARSENSRNLTPFLIWLEAGSRKLAQNWNRTPSCSVRGKFTWLAVSTTPKVAWFGLVFGPP
jgi:hypothetical protein